MKAFLLAAGYGTRLRPVTGSIPKPLVEIGGRTLLDFWLDTLAAAGVTEVLVNLHYLPELVRKHLDRRTGPPAVIARFEPELLGSAGTLRAARDWVQDDDFFLACHVDNLTDFDPKQLIEAHHGEATLTAFHSANPSAGGVIETDASHTMTGFTEKPADPVSDLVNAGIYAFAPSILDDIPEQTPSDIGYHLLPKLTGRAKVITIEGYFRDIGTLDSLQQARQDWPAQDWRAQ